MWSACAHRRLGREGTGRLTTGVLAARVLEEGLDLLNFGGLSGEGTWSRKNVRTESKGKRGGNDGRMDSEVLLRHRSGGERGFPSREENTSRHLRGRRRKRERARVP